MHAEVTIYRVVLLACVGCHSVPIDHCILKLLGSVSHCVRSQFCLCICMLVDCLLIQLWVLIRLHDNYFFDLLGSQRLQFSMLKFNSVFVWRYCYLASFPGLTFSCCCHCSSI